MSSIWRLSLLVALLGGVVVARDQVPSTLLQASGREYDPKPPNTQPGVDSWTQFRGDLQGTGYSHSPRPKYKGIKWKYFIGGSVTSAPVVVNGQVIAVTETGYIHAVDTDSGKKVWGATLGEGGIGQGVVHSSGLVFNGRIYYGSKPGRLYCVSAKDGRTIWSKQLTTKRDRIDPAVPIYASPKGDDRGIIVPTMSGEIYCLDPETGDTRWKVLTHREMGGSAVVLQDLVYVATKGRQVYEIDYNSGTVYRRLKLPGTTHCSPALGMGYLFLTVGNDQGVAIDLVPQGKGEAEKSPVRWTVKAEGQPRNAMTFRDGVVYFRDRARVFAANAHTGAELWSRALTYKPVDPMLVGDEIILAARDGVMKVVKVKDGQEVFNIDLGLKLHQGPIVVDGVIYQGTIDNYLVAIE